MVTQINYKSTLKGLESNHHLLIMMASMLKLDEQVYESRACRAFFTFGMTRILTLNAKAQTDTQPAVL